MLAGSGSNRVDEGLRAAGQEVGGRDADVRPEVHDHLVGRVRVIVVAAEDLVDREHVVRRVQVQVQPRQRRLHPHCRRVRPGTGQIPPEHVHRVLVQANHVARRDVVPPVEHGFPDRARVAASNLHIRLRAAGSDVTASPSGCLLHPSRSQHSIEQTVDRVRPRASAGGRRRPRRRRDQVAAFERSRPVPVYLEIVGIGHHLDECRRRGILHHQDRVPPRPRCPRRE